jgi:hypothetical protein
MPVVQACVAVSLELDVGFGGSNIASIRRLGAL